MQKPSKMQINMNDYCGLKEKANQNIYVIPTQIIAGQFFSAMLNINVKSFVLWWKLIRSNRAS
jgi:hypothetical protein